MASLAPQRQRTSPLFPAYLLKEQLQFALLVWAGFTAFTLALILTVAAFREIEVSGWDRAAQAVRWYALFIGIHVGWHVLPLHVAYGQTRREFMRQAAGFIVLFSAGVSVLATLNYALEAGLYELVGWPQDVQPGQLFDSALELHLVFLQSWLLVGLWCAGGAWVASAWYRSDGHGALALALAIVFSGISGIALSADWGPFGAIYEHLFGEDSIGGVLGVAIHLALVAIVLGLMWLAVRDVPLRNKSA